MRTYVGSQISEHMAWSPEGYLICTNCVLCRTGTQQYAEREITDSGSNQRVTVHRNESDVLSDQHIGSLEGKPLTGPTHPPTFLSPQNIAAFQKGHVQNVRKGTLPTGEACLIGDLIITDRQLAEQVARGRLRELSTGYDCSYRMRDDGDLDQFNFLGNHIAIVERARANEGRPATVAIMDGGPMECTEEQIAAALNMLSQVTNALATEPRRTQDADVSKRNAAALSSSYADAVNLAGSRMRREKDCRSNLRRSAEDSEPKVPKVSPEQRLAAYIKAEEYATECRRLWRKSSPSS
jgi:hypothetical protein